MLYNHITVGRWGAWYNATVGYITTPNGPQLISVVLTGVTTPTGTPTYTSDPNWWVFGCWALFNSLKNQTWWAGY